MTHVVDDDRLRQLIRDAFADDGDTAIAMIERVARINGHDANALAMRVLMRGQDSINQFRAAIHEIERNAPTSTSNFN